MTQRRLPVYLLLDCSGSMCGEPVESMRQGIKALVSDLRSDPQALETAYLSVIIFNSGAAQLAPLEELTSFVEPELQASGSTNMGQALGILITALKTECRRGNGERRGDYKPLVFLMTDGCPSDRWEEQAAELSKGELCTMVACAAGPGANVSMLQKITETVVILSSLQPDEFKNFFRWVSASIKMTSVRPEGNKLASPPSGIVIVR